MKKWILLMLVLVCSLALSVPAGAAVTLSLNPAAQTVGLGNQAVLTLDISGLGDGAAPTVGAFDLDITWDPAILSYNSFEFGLGLGDVDAFEAYGWDTPGSGSVNLFEISLLWDYELDALQRARVGVEP